MVSKEEIRRREVKMVQSPAGPIEQVPNLKRRQRAVYYREIQGKWHPTMPLPADAVNKELYLNKGFRLSPPGEESAIANSPDLDKEALLAEIKRQDDEIKQLKAEQKKKVSLE